MYRKSEVLVCTKKKKNRKTTGLRIQMLDPTFQEELGYATECFKKHAHIKYCCETCMVHVDIALEWQHTERITYREVTGI